LKGKIPQDDDEDLIDLSKSPILSQYFLPNGNTAKEAPKENKILETVQNGDLLGDVLANAFKPDHLLVISADDVMKDLRKTIKKLQSLDELTLKEKERVDHLLNSLQYEATAKYKRNDAASKNFLGFSKSNERSQKHQTTIKKAEADETVL